MEVGIIGVLGFVILVAILIVTSINLSITVKANSAVITAQASRQLLPKVQKSKSLPSTTTSQNSETKSALDILAEAAETTSSSRDVSSSDNMLVTVTSQNSLLYDNGNSTYDVLVDYSDGGVTLPYGEPFTAGQWIFTNASGQTYNVPLSSNFVATLTNCHGYYALVSTIDNSALQALLSGGYIIIQNGQYVIAQPYTLEIQQA